MPGGRTQRGALLLEFMVVAILSLALAIWASHEWAQRARALQARSLAAWMDMARDAADAFLARHAIMLAAAPADDALAGLGFADWTAPRWEELREAGLLAGGWQDTGPLRRTLGLRVVREGVCPGAACRIRALVHARPALQTAAGQVDEALVAEWLQAAGGRGLVVWPHQPGFLGGAGLRIPVPVPGAADWAPGTVALAARAASRTGRRHGGRHGRRGLSSGAGCARSGFPGRGHGPGRRAQRNAVGRARQRAARTGLGGLEKPARRRGRWADSGKGWACWPAGRGFGRCWRGRSGAVTC